MDFEGIGKTEPDLEGEEKLKYRPEVYDPSLWEEVRGDVVGLESGEWGKEGFEGEDLRVDFNNPNNVVVILRDTETGKVIGFTYAEPLLGFLGPDGKDENPNFRSEIEREDRGAHTAYISDTVIHPDYRGRHLVGSMMGALENGLRARGFEFIERDVASKNGYARNVVKNNAERIVLPKLARDDKGEIIFPEDLLEDSEYGPQLFLRMRIEKEGK